MGLTKSDIFSDEQNKLASLFKVFGHPARVAILQYIINQKPAFAMIWWIN
jgi:hypothetical protein